MLAEITINLPLPLVVFLAGTCATVVACLIWRDYIAPFMFIGLIVVITSVAGSGKYCDLKEEQARIARKNQEEQVSIAEHDKFIAQKNQEWNAIIQDSPEPWRHLIQVLQTQESTSLKKRLVREFCSSNPPLVTPEQYTVLVNLIADLAGKESIPLLVEFVDINGLLHGGTDQ